MEEKRRKTGYEGCDLEEPEALRAVFQEAVPVRQGLPEEITRISGRAEGLRGFSAFFLFPSRILRRVSGNPRREIIFSRPEAIHERMA